ncbi:unnamed protein product [Trifolium pratense]|uniref:Uncharacterized protein n=1 Tax=Trifolium pratense TaxID=57577 RepID=A0ACB0KJT0_TRIPR|nr:unnamed protein product [Trifolium pratense]
MAASIPDSSNNYMFDESGVEAAHEPEGDGVEIEVGGKWKLKLWVWKPKLWGEVEIEVVGVETKAMEDEAANVETEAAPSLKRSVDSDVASQGSQRG